MAENRNRTKAELKRLYTNLKRKGITDDMAAILIELCYNEKPNLRTSGFYWPGAPDMIMTWSDATRTLTLTPREPDTGTEEADEYNPHFRFYSWAGYPIFHRRYEPEEITLPNQEGLYAIYYDINEETRAQQLAYTKDPTFEKQANIYLTKVIVAWIYWNAQEGQAEYYGEERHGSEFVPSVHWWAHQVFNARREYGLYITDLVMGDGSRDIHAQVGISQGVAWHEDIRHVAEGVNSTTGLPILYRTAFGPRVITRAGFPVTGPSRIFFNYGGSLSEAGDGRFVLCHIFWTNCFLNPLIAVMGQAQYDMVTEAIEGAAAELEGLDDWVPHQTRLHITTLIYETKTEFTNSVKARIVGEMTPESIADMISEDNIPALKTGWHPDIQKQMAFSYDETAHCMTIELITDFSVYFVQGVKYKVTGDICFNDLPERPGMNYVTGDGNSWTTNLESIDEHSMDVVFSVAMYRNPRQSQTPYVGWRMHIWEMDGRTRGNIIKQTGLEHLTGLVLSISETNNWEIDVTDGSLRLADIMASIEHDSGKTFGQLLRSLQARRHYLKTYTEPADPGEPEGEQITTHEWEYQDTPPAYVATLAESNEVVINQLIENAWQLTETTDNDYSAMWLIATLDYAHPLKWITGTAFSSDLDQAKELNDPASLVSVIEAAQFITDHYQVIARVMVKNIPDEPYYELIEIKQYGDGEFEKLVKDIYVESAGFDSELPAIILHRNYNLPDIIIPLELFCEMSIQGDGSSIFPFTLENDESDPGPLYIYATNKEGEKGWWPLYDVPGESSGSDSGSGSGHGSGSGSSSGSGETPLVPGLLADKYITSLLFNTETRKLTLRRSEGLSDLEVIIPGGGEDNVQSDWNQTDTEAADYIKNKPEITNGEDGEDAYVYVAYASDNTGTDFSLTPSDSLKYRAEIHVTEELDPPTENDFSAATWVKYIGDDGDPGAPGQDADDSFDVYIDFTDAEELEFVYNCPAALKFTQQVSEGAAATLNPVLNTSMAQFDKLTVTAAEVGLIILKGELL